MSTTLKIAYGYAGTTTLDINDVTNYELADEYQPVSAGPLTATTTETIPLIVKGSSVSNLQTNRSAVIDALRKAVEFWNRQQAQPSYLQFQPSGAAVAWRSRIHNFTIADEPGVFGAPWQYSKVTRIDITIERDNWWEANSDTQISLTNDNGTDNTSGLVVYDSAEGTGTSPSKRVSYVEIASTKVTGDLPAAYRLEMLNSYNNTEKLWDVMVGHQYISATTTPILLEAESADFVDSAGTADWASANFSGGHASIETLLYANPVTLDNVIDLYGWNLSAASVLAANGGMFHCILRYIPSYPTNGTYFRLKLVALPDTATSLADGVVLSQSSWALTAVNGEVANFDLGAMRIPPNLGGLTGLGSLAVGLGAMQTLTSPSLDQTFDCLYLMPADGWRRYNGLYSIGVAYGQRLVDDTINNFVYRDAGDGTAKTPFPLPTGEIMLRPGVTQRLYFLVGPGNNAQCKIDRTLTVKLYYRPRRLTL